MIGIGIPLGNTNALPYIKQYSAGGSFSNRGWVARTLGPGRSVDSSYKAGFTTIDRTGDMKLEANSELRFNVWTLFSGAINLKGAAFVDAGNIWLYSKNSNIEGGEFNPKYFYRDLAVSAGIGARFDFSFFVFRIDHAYPLKQPQYNANNGWAFDILTYKSGIWNIAIGYPF
jgi:outer membrane protein assembly factor BamA